MQTLTLERKVGQLFFVGISGPEIDGSTAGLLSSLNPGGICLFARNIRSASQTRELNDALRKTLPRTPFLSIDQEGGLVDRLRRIMTPMPAASKFKRAEDVREFAAIVAEALRILAFNMNFAPVVDVIDEKRESTTNGLYSRGFGSNVDRVIEFADAFLTELQNGGVIGCLKHFPGLGAASIDSHEDLPQVETEDSELKTVDLAPYREIKGCEMVMVAHAAYPHTGLQERDQDGRLLPSSLSKSFVTKLLRDEIGFGGVAISDDLEMGAIFRNYGIGEASKMAVKAGNDMLAICANENAIREGFEAVLNAVNTGEIAESRVDKSLERIELLRSKLSPPLQFNQLRLSELADQIKDLTARLG